MLELYTIECIAVNFRFQIQFSVYFGMQLFLFAKPCLMLICNLCRCPTPSVSPSHCPSSSAATELASSRTANFSRSSRTTLTYDLAASLGEPFSRSYTTVIKMFIVGFIICHTTVLCTLTKMLLIISFMHEFNLPNLL